MLTDTDPNYKVGQFYWINRIPIPETWVLSKMLGVDEQGICRYDIFAKITRLDNGRWSWVAFGIGGNEPSRFWAMNTVELEMELRQKVDTV